MQSILIGLDIGGVNIKCSSIPRARETRLEDAFSTKKYFPLWQSSRDALPSTLEEILSEHVQHWYVLESKKEKTTIIPCASITGELSDAYASKKEGITHITRSLQDACVTLETRNASLCIENPSFVSTDGKLRDVNEAIADHRAVAAANWYATAIWIGTIVKDCILIDCGSTTTDIIPIIGGMPVMEGLTDLERLQSGELVYTGTLRATIPSIAHELPVNGIMTPVSFEKFALMADVHVILENITQDQYDCDTADGRSTSIDNCKKRLARSICEDAEELEDATILEIAQFLQDAQIDIIWTGLQKVTTSLASKSGISCADLDCVLTGIGENALAGPAAARAGFRSLVPLSIKIGTDATIISSAIGVLHVLTERLKQGFE